ncbi:MULTISPECIES: fimbrial protein [Atlantibacter]|nr:MULTISPECIES: fimbrial protein [Atlantibacter]MBL7637222.1 fimbrial protein [Atlantibacter hermannii]MBL7676340.1 fimbrial protein [Atlantibacter hermannii]
MLKNKFLSLLILVISGNVFATCQLDQGTPHIFNIKSATITIDASARQDTSVPIYEDDSGPQGAELSYINCDNGEMYGRNVMHLSGQDSSTKIFQTNVPGIGIKVLMRNNNGGNPLNFPASGPMQFEDGSAQGRFVCPAESYFTIQLFKTQPTLTLTNKGGDVVLPAEEIAYTWVTADNPAKYTRRLNIGQLMIISTPSCTYDNAKTVDFGTVTTNTLTASGIARDLDFSLICKTDYGNYSASAAISTQTATSDLKYIKVKDAAGNMDRLAIKITDSKNNDMMVDGSTNEILTSVANDVAAEFKWHATLYPTGNGKLPENGAFTAQAEILLQVK